MSEPQAVAESVEEVVPGVWHWHVADERIGGHISSAHAVRADGGVVLVDPLPLSADALAGLGDVTSIFGPNLRITVMPPWGTSRRRTLAIIGARGYVGKELVDLIRGPDGADGSGGHDGIELAEPGRLLFGELPGHRLRIGGVIDVIQRLLRPIRIRLEQICGDIAPGYSARSDRIGRCIQRKVADGDLVSECVSRGAPVRLSLL